jgi:hypothetical protein
MENQSNPLKNYFRKPGIWIKLPSLGKFYKDKPLELNEMGEVPVYPMTAKDELLMKNADALLNGTAVTQLIRSCVPCIQDPESMPSIDLDALLLAIRRSTYGENMDVSTQHDCQANATTDSTLNLNAFISTIKTIDSFDPVELENKIKVFVKPVSVKQLLQLNWIQYEQIRNLQIAEQQNLDEKSKVNILQNSYILLTQTNLEIISQCIETVLLPDSITVTDPGSILEWVQDLDSPTFKLIENAVMSLGSKGVEKKFQVTCSKCNKNYETELNLNPTTFFG